MNPDYADVAGFAAKATPLYEIGEDGLREHGGSIFHTSQLTCLQEGVIIMPFPLYLFTILEWLLERRSNFG
jgi:hypothetical protein